jgi:hypothetical protein
MDKIQKVLVAVGRKDLAQEYYKKIAAKEISIDEVIGDLSAKLSKYKISWLNQISRRPATRNIRFFYEKKDDKISVFTSSDGGYKGIIPDFLIDTDKKEILYDNKDKVKKMNPFFDYKFTSLSSLRQKIKDLAYILFNGERSELAEAERRLDNPDLWNR